MSDNWRAVLGPQVGVDAVLPGDTLWDAARPGPVGDVDTGELVIDLTPELLAGAIKAFEVQKARGVRVPFDLNHGLFRHPHDEKKSRTYGLVESMSIDEATGKLQVKPRLNVRGSAMIAGSVDENNEGTLSLSPVVRGPFYDPRTREKVSDCYFESIAIGSLVMQDGLESIALGKDAAPLPITLAKFDSKVEYDEFRESLEQAARALLKSLGHQIDWVNVKDWGDAGSDAGTLAATFWSGEDQHLFIMDWSRADDGTVTVTNARPGKERVTYIETETHQTEAAVALAKEAHMRKFDPRALVAAFALAESGKGIALGKGDESSEIEVPEAVADVLDAVLAKGESLTAELTKAQAELVKAEARVEQAESKAGDAVALGKRVEEAEAAVEAINAERAAEKAEAECDAFVAALAKNGSISEGRIDKDSGERIGDQRPAWRKRYVQLGKEGVTELAGEILAPGTHKPVVLGRGLGFEGEPVRKVDDGSDIIAAAAKAGMSVADYALKGGN